MKFVKFKNRKRESIFAITKEDDKIISYENNEISGCFWKQDVDYQQADTIEELCDEFVAVGILTEQPYIVKLPKAYCKNMNVYGAIWTDKGLIYVAKMNKSGELELL